MRDFYRVGNKLRFFLLYTLPLRLHASSRQGPLPATGEARSSGILEFEMNKSCHSSQSGGAGRRPAVARCLLVGIGQFDHLAVLVRPPQEGDSRG